MKLLFLGILLLILMVPALAAENQTYDPAMSGERNLGQELVWTIENVSGYANVTYQVSVYDYRVIGRSYDYWSVDWGQWFAHYSDNGKKYLAVWVRTESYGTTWYGWNKDRFKLWIWANKTVSSEAVPFEDLPIKYESDKYRPATIAEFQDLTGQDRQRLTREWYGWKGEEELPRQEPGPSNAWDGIILYQIPEDAEPEDIRVLGWFGWEGYGYGVWYLTEHDDLIQIPKPAAAKAEVTISAPPSARGRITLEPTNAVIVKTTYVSGRKVRGSS